MTKCSIKSSVKLTLVSAASIAAVCAANAQTINVITGWNLLGYSGASPLTASQIGNTDKYQTAWKWNSATGKWAFFTPTMADGGKAYADSKGYDFMNSVNTGDGFWINAIAPFSVSLSTGSVGTTSSKAVLATATDAFMVPYLKSNGITAATLAIMKNGEVLFEKAYGYKDLSGTIPLTTDALMTGASIVKPVTGAAIQNLATTNNLSLSDKVFCAAGVEPSSANHCWISKTWVSSTDPRIQNITIAHLLAHKGGWDRSQTNCYAYQISPSQIRSLLSQNGNPPCEPTQHEAIVQNVGGFSTPPTLEQDIRFFMNSGLDFTPGSSVMYSNFGYMLLGLIIERASGLDFNTYVNRSIMSPLGVNSNDFKTTYSLLVNADPREPNYITSVMFQSVFEPGTLVPVRNGAVNAVNFVAAATTSMTSKAMATFAGKFKIDTDSNSVDGIDNGKPLGVTTNNAYHFGTNPGTAAIVRQFTSGVSYAVLMNKNDLFEGPGNRINYVVDVKAGIDAVIATAGY